ncbi:MAG TPA: hypothetical protein VLV86_21740 [Vicinamibacterales bacterium]|nr:hypothetical protein [Vicinamibacterales bacterium]
MTRHGLMFAAAALLLVASSGAAAQQPAAPPSAAPPPTAAPPAAAPAAKDPVVLKVQVVISRHQGEKTVSRQPVTMMVSVDSPPANFRMGVQVPVQSTTNDGKTAFNYRDVGTNIDCTARTVDGGRFRLTFSLDDSSVAVDDQTVRDRSATDSALKGVPQFHAFRLSNVVAILRDGQTTQLTSATEKGSGEVITVDVTMNVIK